MDHQQHYVIGIDGGASSTKAVILDQTGQVLGRGQAGSSNYHNVGLEAARTALDTAIEAALLAANLARTQIRAAGWALAGVGRPADRARMQALADELLPGISTRLENDAVGALIGGVGAHRGIVLIAGTGMIAYGEAGPDRRARAGGWGNLLDKGSGYALGLAALRAACEVEDGGTPATRLVERLRAATGLNGMADIPIWLYAPERSVADVAALAEIVLDEAEKGDRLAVELAGRGAAELAEAVDHVARRLALWGESFPLILSGSLLTANPFYQALVSQAISTRIPQIQPQLPQRDAAVGAGLLALETLGQPLSGYTSTTTTSPNIWVSEQRNLLTQNLDLQTTLEIVGLMHLADQQAVAAMHPLLPTIATVIDAIAERMRQGGRLLYAGAGTSGRLGVLDASECPPTFSTDPSQVIGLIAGGQPALTNSIEGAEDDREAGAAAVAKLNVGPLDSLIGIAASGRTPYAIGALEEARQRGALTVAVTCNLPAPMTEPAAYVIAPLVGPEIISGSTRMKAGTTQKLVLNMLSTGVMVRLGKTYGNLMVDVQAANLKLQARARRIVAQACSIDEDTAAQALAAANGAVKVAIVSMLLDCSPEEARKRLAEAGGVIRMALAGVEPS